MDIDERDQFDLTTPDEGASPGQAPPGADSPSRLGVLAWVGAAIVGLIIGFVVLGRGGGEPTPLPGQNGPKRSPAPVGSAPLGPGRRQYLSVSNICTPITDHRTKLSIPFELSNISPFGVEIDSVQAVMPRGGLRVAKPATAGGSCQSPGRDAAARHLNAGDGSHYTVFLALPTSCPAQYPVQVRVRFHANGFAETSLSVLTPDLSVPEFDACPTSPKASTMDYLNVGNICPVITDGRTQLRVSFELQNISGTGVELLDVRPSLPLPGLRAAGPTTAGGSCSQPGSQPIRGPMAAGSSRLFTMTFRLPTSCPQPLPILAAYRLSVEGRPLTARVGIFSDLGSVNFATCPARHR